MLASLYTLPATHRSRPRNETMHCLARYSRPRTACSVGFRVWLLNRAGRFRIARVLVIGTVYAHIPVVLSLISAGSGCHLFYFPMAAAVAAVLGSPGRSATVLFVGLGALLYVWCHFAFPPGTTPVVMSQTTLDAMYAGSAAGVLLVTGGFSYLFRIEIDRAVQVSYLPDTRVAGVMLKQPLAAAR